MPSAFCQRPISGLPLTQEARQPPRNRSPPRLREDGGRVQLADKHILSQITPLLIPRDKGLGMAEESEVVEVPGVGA